MSDYKNPYIVFWAPGHKKHKIIKEFLENSIVTIDKNLRINKKFNTEENEIQGWFYTYPLYRKYDDIFNILINICNNTIKELEKNKTNS